MRKAKPARRVLLFLLMLLLSAVILLPMLLTICNSFMEASELTRHYGRVLSPEASAYMARQTDIRLIPERVSFSQYYTALFQSPDYLFKFWNSLFYVVPIVFFQVFIALLASYSFARFRSRFKEALLFVYTIVMLMPYQVTMVPNYIVANGLQILDTRWSIWLPGITAPFSVYLLTKFMRKIPMSFFEAAKVDGAGEWSIFSKISLPLCKNATASVVILVFVDYWNMVEQPVLMLTDMDLYPLSVYLSKINAEEVGVAFAIAVIYMVLPMLIFLYGEEYLVEGIVYQGGIKG